MTYRHDFGNVRFSIDAQFDGSNDQGASYFFNTGISYDTDLIYTAVAYYTREISYGKTEKNLGTMVAKNFGLLYFAAAYPGIEIERLNSSTLDIVASYTIKDNYKIKFGISMFDDGINNAKSEGYSAYHTNVDWYRTADFNMFVKYQKTDFDHSKTNDRRNAL